MENTTSFNASLNNSMVDHQTRIYHTEFFDTVGWVFGVLNLLLIPVIVIGNLLLIVTVVTSTNLRREFRHKVIVSVALADLLIGLISCPIRANILLPEADHRFNCAKFVLFSVTEEYVQMFVATWGIVTINFEYLLSLFRVKLPKLSPLKEKLCVALILVLPWLAMAFLVLPVAYAHAREDVGPFHWCYLHIPFRAKQIVYAFTFAIPSITIVSQIITMAIYHSVHQNNVTPSLMSSSEIITSPWVFVVAGVVTVGLVGIEQSLHMAWMEVRRAPWKVRYVLSYSCNSLSDTKSAVTPLIWFALPELRNAFKSLSKRLKLPWKQISTTKNDNSVIYKNCGDDSI